jgi:hypothetical protein
VILTKITSCPETHNYTWIVVGSGNGACAFLNQFFEELAI